MKDKEFIRKLKLLKYLRVGGEPSRDFVARNREILMMQVKNAFNAEHREASRFGLAELRQFASTLVPVNLNRYVFRQVLVGCLALSVVMSGWVASVSASANSIPGDTLYSLKIATERARLALVSDKDNRAKLQVEFAGRRLKEVSKIAENQMPEKEKRAQMAILNFKNQMNSVSASLEEVKISESPVKVAEVAKIIDRKSSEYHDVLVKTETSLPEAQTQVVEAKQIVNDAGIRAVQAIMEKQLENKTIVSDQEITEKVQEKLKTAEAAVADISLKIDETAGQNMAATGTVNSVKDAAREAEATLNQAKELIEKNDISAAIVKIAEANSLTTEAQKAAISSGLFGTASSTMGSAPASDEISDNLSAPAVTAIPRIDTKYKAQGLEESVSGTEVTAQGVESATSVQVEAQSVGDEEIIIPETLMDLSETSH
jgi:hypothetical protein